MITLNSYRLIELDEYSWCMTAQIENTMPANMGEPQLVRQRSAVRQLLQTMLARLDIDDELDDSEFPYRLRENRYYVCFSHSNNKVAVALSCRRHIGLDIEDREVPWTVAKRFFHNHEITVLKSLSKDQRLRFIQTLWQIKESYIKINNDKLTMGLGIDYSHILTRILGINTNTLSLVTIEDSKTDYKITLLNREKTVVVH